MFKLKEKQEAIKLRRKGYSYSEILKEIPISKSTLSLWLRNVGLVKEQKQRLTEKKLKGALKGAQKKKNQRLQITQKIKEMAKNEIDKISKRELQLIGIALYWAEGTKQKEHNVSERVKLNNSDPKIIKLFLKWLREICKVSDSDIQFRISLHKNAAKRLDEIKKYWARVTGFPIAQFQKVDWKKHNPVTKRKNVGKTYFGLLNIIVKRSTNLNRKISGWIEGICENCGVV